MKPTRSSKTKTVKALVKIPADLADEAKKMAKARGCSVPEFIRNLLRVEAFNA